MHPENPGTQGSKGPNGETKSMREVINEVFSSVSWQALKILKGEPGPTKDDEFLTFETTFKVVVQKGQKVARDNVLHKTQERSHFRRENSRWLYLDGEQIPS
jgi:uncharacterized protein YchJ